MKCRAYKCKNRGIMCDDCVDKEWWQGRDVKPKKPKFDKKTMIKIVSYDPPVTRWVYPHHINTSTAVTTHNIVDSKTGIHDWIDVAGQTTIELKGTVVK